MVTTRLTLLGMFMLLLGIASPNNAWLFKRTGRQEAQIPISQECIDKAREGRCDFYTCFDQRHPCEHHNYALAFGWKFCTQFDLHYHRLDNEGKRWVNASRLCSMEAMLDIYNEEHINCRDVKAAMLDAHGSCGAQHGVCSIDFIQNNNHVFEDIYGADKKSFQRFIQSLKHCGRTMFERLGDWIENTAVEILPKIHSFFKGVCGTIRHGILGLWRRITNRN